MVKFNVTISKRLKIMVLGVNTKHIHIHNVILDNTVTKFATILPFLPLFSIQANLYGKLVLQTNLNGKKNELKKRQKSIFPRNQFFLSEKWKTWTSSNYHRV